MGKKSAIFKNYRGASKQSDERCSNCKWYLKNMDNNSIGDCKAHEFVCNANFVCDDYLEGRESVGLKSYRGKYDERLIREYQQIPDHANLNISHPKAHIPVPKQEEQTYTPPKSIKKKNVEKKNKKNFLN